MKIPDLEQPVNANERFLHAVALRLDVLIHQNNSIVDGLARLLKEVPESNKVENVSVQVEEKPVVEEPKRPSRKKASKG